jgi:hypothetical protein
MFYPGASRKCSCAPGRLIEALQAIERGSRCGQLDIHISSNTKWLKTLGRRLSSGPATWQRSPQMKFDFRQGGKDKQCNHSDGFRTADASGILGVGSRIGQGSRSEVQTPVAEGIIARLTPQVQERVANGLMIVSRSWQVQLAQTKAISSHRLSVFPSSPYAIHRRAQSTHLH